MVAGAVPTQGTAGEVWTGHRITVVREAPRRCWLAASGELDLAACDEVADVLARQCASGNCFAQLDLSAVTFLDCACLGALVTAHHAFLSAHGTLILTGVGPQVSRLLALTGLDRQLFTVPAGVAPDDGARQARSAQANRAVLEQATGIVMSRRHCTREKAAARLQLLARRTNRTVTDVAQSMVDNAGSPAVWNAPRTGTTAR